MSAFVERLLGSGDADEVRMRLFTAALLVGLGAYAQALLNGRREAEERLLDNEQRYRRLVEQLPAIVYILEPSHGEDTPYPVAYMSPQVESILGYVAQRFVDDPGF